MILLIDNYDSFVFNLARYFRRLGQDTQVVRNDAIDIAGIRALQPEAIVLSPGPCTPHEAGCSLEVVRKLKEGFPMLGVCLGHQAIAEAFGGRVVRATEPMHGRTSPVYHEQQGLMNGLPKPTVACRYHSLVVEKDSLPAELLIDAELQDGTVMAIRHQSLPIFGVQFHPESVLTDVGYPILTSFLRAADIPIDVPSPNIESERRQPPPVSHDAPTGPVTF